MKYIIECSKEDYSTLEEQISKALNKRIELYSRAKLSGLWRVIDGLNNTKRLSQEKLDGRKNRYRFYGTLFCISGVMFILLGLLDPLELKAFKYYGLFLLLIGILYIHPKKDKKRNLKEITKVIESLKSNNEKSTGLKLLFDTVGMYSQDDELLLRYEDIDNVIITQDIFCFIHARNLIPILKRDLVEVSVKEFEEFLVQVFQYKVCYAN